MDKIYVGDDIPLDFNYLSFDKNGNMILTRDQSYNAGVPHDRYIIFKNPQNKFIYTYSTHTNMDSNYVAETYVELSNKWYDRPDMLNILCLFCCVAVLTLWLTNLFTSIFKKGGILSGLF